MTVRKHIKATGVTIDTTSNRMQQIRDISNHLKQNNLSEEFIVATLLSMNYGISEIGVFEKWKDVYNEWYYNYSHIMSFYEWVSINYLLTSPQ